MAGARGKPLAMKDRSLLLSTTDIGVKLRPTVGSVAPGTSMMTLRLTVVVLLTLSGPLAADDGVGKAEAPVGSTKVEGLVTYTGPMLEPIPVAEAGTARHPVEVHPKTKGLKDAVVWLENVPIAGGRAAAVGPARMDQQNYFFVPHVLAIEAGQSVEFTNSDVANHGVTSASLSGGNRFNVVTPPGGKYTHRFVADKRPVSIGCPIHAAMAGWVFVFEHPFHAVTEADGSFRLPPVPPGRYILHVRHPDGGMTQEQRIEIPRGRTRLRVEFNEGDLKAGRGKTR